MNSYGLTPPPAGGGVSDETAAFAAELIDRSGKAPVIEAALAHATGRPRPLPVRAVLTALACLALDDRPLFLTEATRLLFCQLSETSRGLLGVPGTVTTEPAFLAACRLRDRFGAICSVMDPSALPENWRPASWTLKARTRLVTPGQAEAARGRLEAFINALLEASISALTGEELAAYDGCTGLDATPVPLFSRGPSKRTGLCASDPDGGWYVREGDHREREDDKGKPLRKISWVLEATIAIMALAARRSRTRKAPLAIGLALARPGEDPGGTGARVLASVAARGHRPAGSATTAPTPRPSPGASTSPHAPWATGPSWTTAPASSASRQTPAEPSSRKEPGTAPPCPGRSSPPPPACATTPSPARSMTSRRARYQPPAEPP